MKLKDRHVALLMRISNLEAPAELGRVGDFDSKAINEDLIESRERLRVAVKQSPRDPELRAALGAVCQRLGDVAAAVDQYEHAILLGFHDVQVWANLAEARLGLGEHDAALDAFEIVFALEPSRVHPAKTRARALIVEAAFR